MGSLSGQWSRVAEDYPASYKGIRTFESENQIYAFSDPTTREGAIPHEETSFFHNGKSLLVWKYCCEASNVLPAFSEPGCIIAPLRSL